MPAVVAPVRAELYRLAPEIFQTELRQWIQNGVEPHDDLLCSILRNDLGGVVAYCASDAGCWILARATLMWLWNTAPAQSFGTPARIERWHGHGGEEGWEQ